MLSTLMRLLLYASVHLHNLISSRNPGSEGLKIRGLLRRHWMTTDSRWRTAASFSSKVATAY